METDSVSYVWPATGFQLLANRMGSWRLPNRSPKHQTGAKFITTTYIPEGYISYDHSRQHRRQSFGHQVGPPCYDGMDIGLDEIDVFFVYPWPGEQEMMLKLFQFVASIDAILITYYGDREICIYRKQ